MARCTWLVGWWVDGTVHHGSSPNSPTVAVAAATTLVSHRCTQHCTATHLSRSLPLSLRLSLQQQQQQQSTPPLGISQRPCQMLRPSRGSHIAQGGDRTASQR